MTGDDPLAPLLERQGVAILDGGLATELERRGHDLSDELWSARLLVDRPDAIEELHFDYLAAGADCVIGASYQASFEGFSRRGLGSEEARTALERSVEVARAARRRFWSDPARRAGRRRPLVAASVGPYGAFLADGSEYRGDYGVSERDLLRFHRERFRTLAESGADLLACESIPSRPEATVLARLIADTPGIAAWISFTCRDGATLSDGTPLAEAAAEVEGAPGLVALGVNCTAPRHLSSLIELLGQATSLPIVAYPNRGEGWDAARRRWLPASGEPTLAAAAPEWVARGARLVGGCCRTGPSDIRRLRAALLSRPASS
ncbi:MAG: homocysteine S-methyltransferase [Thermoanaerobaculia bacterium]|nr:homocysteine S-methyltransferase [Thermoanaerobaculia bacterium]